MRRILTVFLLLLTMGATARKAVTVASPDGRTVVSLQTDRAGRPQYQVKKGDVPVLNWSQLGFRMDSLDFSQGFKITGTDRAQTDTTWETVYGEDHFIRDHHNELRVTLQQKMSNKKLVVVFRVFNDGFALRYEFPEENQLGWFTIQDELTEFRFPPLAETLLWSIPWRADYYEALWTRHALNQLRDTVCAPVTLQLDADSYGFLHEAALTDYPAANFFPKDSCTLGVYLTPWANGDKAYETDGFQSPWRFMTLADDLSELVASRIMLNLNEPCALQNTSFIRPMKFMGIWWGMHMKSMTWRQGPIHGATTENMSRYLRFAAEHGFGGVLAEGWNTGWEGYEGVRPGERFSFVTPYPDYDIDSLSRLAHALGVQIICHHETSGHADQYQQELDTAYRYMAHYGMHNVKTGYVAPVITTLDGLQLNKSQSGVRHYRTVIETAAKYGVCIDNHEPVMPTGLCRTYPNLMTQEGIRGQEWNAWSADGGSPASHVCTLPFTRMLAGPADYTPGVFSFENPVMPGTRVHSTLANQCALFVTLYSPLQMACDLPENYMKHPDMFRFIEHVPCDWEQSLLLQGSIGEYLVMARQQRNTDNWYMGGTTNDEARDIFLWFPFLQEGKTYHATIYRDAPDADWRTNPYAHVVETLEITRQSTLPIHMASGGGFAIEIK